MILLSCDQKLTKSRFSPTHASTNKKITEELKHNAEWYGVREGSPVEVQWAVGTLRIASLCLNFEAFTLNGVLQTWLRHYSEHGQ